MLYMELYLYVCILVRIQEGEDGKKQDYLSMNIHFNNIASYQTKPIRHFFRIFMVINIAVNNL